MSFVLGVILFALCIGISVMLHEAGHMWTARMFGMRVRRFFVGMGPTIWSLRRGEIEYGIKALPVGGFCDIAGMTALDEVTPEEAPRAMWRFKMWKRLIVMCAGSITHFILGFLVVYVMAVALGLPNVADKAVVAQVAPCAQTAALSTDNGKQKLTYLPCAPGAPAPAQRAGMRAGDEIVSVAGQDVQTWTQAVGLIQSHRGNTPIVVDRDGKALTLNVNIAQVTGIKQNTDPNDSTLTAGQVGAIGAGQVRNFSYDGWSAIGGAGAFTGQLFANVYEGIKRLPERIPALISAIGGAPRSADTPISVVGASIIGGDAVQSGSWALFLYLLTALNFFFGVFNLLPLLPMDGGHIAVLLYEKVRNWLRRLRGLAPGGPVDYTKLTGLTMVFIFIGGAMMLLTITADIVNPIRFQ